MCTWFCYMLLHVSFLFMQLYQVWSRKSWLKDFLSNGGWWWRLGPHLCFQQETKSSLMTIGFALEAIYIKRNTSHFFGSFDERFFKHWIQTEVWIAINWREDEELLNLQLVPVVFLPTSPQSVHLDSLIHFCLKFFSLIFSILWPTFLSL